MGQFQRIGLTNSYELVLERTGSSTITVLVVQLNAAVGVNVLIAHRQASVCVPINFLAASTYITFARHITAPYVIIDLITLVEIYSQCHLATKSPICSM